MSSTAGNKPRDLADQYDAFRRADSNGQLAQLDPPSSTLRLVQYQLPEPLVFELPFEFGWSLWDEAVAAQDKE